jgi:hypothetical protein
MGMTYQRGAVWWVKYYRNGRPIRESSGSIKESNAINLLKLREGDIAHGLPVNPKLNRIRFDEAADDLKTEYGGRPTSSSGGFGSTCFPTSVVDACQRSVPPT